MEKSRVAILLFCTPQFHLLTPISILLVHHFSQLTFAKLVSSGSYPKNKWCRVAFPFIIFPSFKALVWCVRIWKSLWEISFGRGWTKGEVLIWWAGRSKGGLELENLMLHNKTLLAKWLWCFSFEFESLWDGIIASKHDPHPFEWLFNEVKGTSSDFWKDISLELTALLEPDLLCRLYICDLEFYTIFLLSSLLYPFMFFVLLGKLRIHIFFRWSLYSFIFSKWK